MLACMVCHNSLIITHPTDSITNSVSLRIKWPCQSWVMLCPSTVMIEVREHEMRRGKACVSAEKPGHPTLQHRRRSQPASQPERESESEGLTDWLTGLPLLACGGLIDLPSSLLCCAALCACFAPFFTDLLAFASPLLPFYEHPPSWAAMTPNTSPPPRRARFMSSRRSSIRSTRSLPSPCALFSVTNTTFRLARAF